MSKTKPISIAKLPGSSLNFKKELADVTKLATENTYNWDDCGFAAKIKMKILWKSMAFNFSVKSWKSTQSKG